MAEEMKISNLRLHVSFRTDTNDLTDEELGRLVRWGLDYITGEDPPRPAGREGMFAGYMKRVIDEDNDRYIRRCERQRENAKKRWEEKDATACDGMPLDANDANSKSKSISKSIIKEDKEGADAPKPIRHKYGAYGHVLLEDEQLKILQREFPTDWKERIQRMDDYCEANGKTYRNYLQAIRNWARRDGKDIDPNEPSPAGLVALTLRRKA